MGRGRGAGEEASVRGNALLGALGHCCWAKPSFKANLDQHLTHRFPHQESHTARTVPHHTPQSPSPDAAGQALLEDGVLRVQGVVHAGHAAVGGQALGLQLSQSLGGGGTRG